MERFLGKFFYISSPSYTSLNLTKTVTFRLPEFVSSSSPSLFVMTPAKKFCKKNGVFT